jgi:hypothetical protein
VEHDGAVALRLQLPGHGQAGRHGPDVVGRRHQHSFIATGLVGALVAEEPEGHHDHVEGARQPRRPPDHGVMARRVGGVEVDRLHPEGAGGSEPHRRETQGARIATGQDDDARGGRRQGGGDGDANLGATPEHEDGLDGADATGHRRRGLGQCAANQSR